MNNFGSWNDRLKLEEERDDLLDELRAIGLGEKSNPTKESAAEMKDRRAMCEERLAEVNALLRPKISHPAPANASLDGTELVDLRSGKRYVPDTSPRR